MWKQRKFMWLFLYFFYQNKGVEREEYLKRLKDGVATEALFMPIYFAWKRFWFFYFFRYGWWYWYDRNHENYNSMTEIAIEIREISDKCLENKFLEKDYFKIKIKPTFEGKKFVRSASYFWNSLFKEFGEIKSVVVTIFLSSVFWSFIFFLFS